MNQVNQGESSSGLSVYPAKRRRGRPRKDSSLIVAGAVHVPPGYEHGRQELPQGVDRTVEADSVAGRAVTGVVEATFDAGYIITVRIGESTANLRGLVFKPGHVPITAQNDVAPHLPMIRRYDVRPPAVNQALLDGRASAAQTASSIIPPKRKRESPQTALPAPPVGVRGNVVPVILQPVNFLNGSNPKLSDPSQPSMMDFGDKGMHTIEPLATFPRDRCVLAGQQPRTSNQTDKKPHNESVSNENIKPMESTDVDNSSGTSDTQTGSSKEALKSSSEKSGSAPKQEGVDVNKPVSTDQFFPSASAPQTLFNFGTGRMTQLLQAVQENLKDNRVQTGERGQVEFHAK